jgi:DNA-binding CsgD family transcriptional regulator/PAS domain-containing protein
VPLPKQKSGAAKSTIWLRLDSRKRCLFGAETYDCRGAEARAEGYRQIHNRNLGTAAQETTVRGDISQLIGTVCDAALDAGLWPSVLEQFTQTFGGTKAHLAEDNLRSTAGKLVSYGTDPAFPRLYAQYYATRNVLWKNIVQQSLDGVLTDRMIMPREELTRSEFYNDYLQPQGCEEVLCFAGMPHDGICTTLILTREQRYGRWGPRDMRALAQVVPHLRRSLGINRQIGELRIVNELADEALYRISCGLVLVDAEASVLFINRAAEKLFENRSLRLERGRLRAPRASETTQLHRLIAETAKRGIGGSLVITHPSAPPLLVSAMPMRARRAPMSGVVLFVRKIDEGSTPDLTSFARYFGLTAAEAALAVELVNGDGVTAAAARLRISRATARTHLIHIFQKTGTQRQAGLVRLMLTWAEPALHPPDHS